VLARQSTPAGRARAPDDRGPSASIPATDRPPVRRQEARVSDPHDILVTRLMSALSGVLARVSEPEAVLATILQQAVAVSGATAGCSSR